MTIHPPPPIWCWRPGGAQGGLEPPLPMPLETMAVIPGSDEPVVGDLILVDMDEVDPPGAVPWGQVLWVLC